MAKRTWYSGKTINPDFVEAAKKHASECKVCGSVPWGSKAYHYKWRDIAEDCMGEALPPSLLDKAPTKVNRNVSKVQGNWAADKRVVD